MANANEDDWREEVYQKIKSMKEIYLPYMNDVYHRAAARLQREESLPEEQRLPQFEKLIHFKPTLERFIQFLCLSKSNITPALKDKVDQYEKRIRELLNIPNVQHG